MGRMEALVVAALVGPFIQPPLLRFLAPRSF
jgi:hypothetical protein